MQVFHYCAERLKGVALFESCPNSALRKKANRDGALYNDFDGDPASLMKDSDFNEAGPSSQIDASSDIDDPVSQVDIDRLLLQADEVNSARWEKDHHLFINDAEKTDLRYQQSVRDLVAMEEDEWESLPLFDDDFER